MQLFPTARARLVAYLHHALGQEPELVAQAAADAVREAAELTGASGKQKRAHAARALARKLDAAIDWHKYMPKTLVGQVAAELAERLDGPVFRAVAVPLVETAYQAMRKFLASSEPSSPATPDPSPPAKPSPREGTKDAQVLEHWELLGKAPDDEIATKAGVSKRTVKRFRRLHGIADPGGAS